MFELIFRKIKNSYHYKHQNRSKYPYHIHINKLQYTTHRKTLYRKNRKQLA